MADSFSCPRTMFCFLTAPDLVPEKGSKRKKAAKDNVAKKLKWLSPGVSQSIKKESFMGFDDNNRISLAHLYESIKYSSCYRIVMQDFG